jgi:hypothetical protein
MRIIAFIARHQTEVIEKILRHCGLWEERGPPPAPKPAGELKAAEAALSEPNLTGDG